MNERPTIVVWPALWAVAFLTAVAVAGCGSARRSEPLVGPFRAASDDVRRGERVFMAHCHSCHPGGEAGVGPSLNDKPLPSFLIRRQTRWGLGAMPAFSAAAISDADLTALIAYLQARRAG